MRGMGPGRGPGGRGREEFTEFDEKAYEAQSAELLELRYLTKENSRFARTEGGFASLVYRDKSYERVSVYRTFPFSAPEEYISIREPDEKAKEIGVIRALSELDPEQAQIIREHLELRYFMPKIRKITEVRDEYGYAYFDVITDMGEAHFVIPMSGGAIVTLSDVRLIITDLDGNRYEIEDVTKLGSGEQKKLDMYL